MPRRFITRLSRKFGSVHVRGVAALVSGSGLAYAIGILLGPIVSRMYTPSDFGVLSVLISTSSLLAVMATLRFELAIPIEQDEKLVSMQIWLPGITSTMFAVWTFVVLAIWGRTLFALFGLSYVVKYWVVIPVGIVVIAWYQILSFLAIRYQKYSYIAQVKVLQGIGRAGLPIVLGFMFGGMRCCLIGGDILARYVSAYRFFDLMKRRVKRIKLSISFFRALGSRAIAHYRFAVFTMPAALISSGLFLLPPLILGGVYNSVVAGYFSFSQRIVLGPVLLLSQAIAQVYYGYVANAYQSREFEKAYRAFLMSFKRLFLLGLIPSGILLLFGPSLFSFVFGYPWRMSGVYARIMSVPLLLQFCVGPLYQSLNVLRRQQYIFITSVFSFSILVIIAYFAYVKNLSATSFVILYAGMLTVHYIFLFIFTLYNLKYFHNSLHFDF